MLLYSLLLLSVLWDKCLCSKVLQLSPGNFNATIHSEPLLMVIFQAPWCTHCKKVGSELVEAAEDLVEMAIKAKIATVDVSLAGNAQIAEREEIVGYPTLLVYRNGSKLGEYYGGRTQKDIVDYLKQKSRPAVQYISSLMELVPLTDQFEAGQMQEAGFFSIVLGAFTPADEADPNKGILGKYGVMFNNTAAHYDLALFFVTDNPMILSQLGITADSIVVFQEFPDETSATFPFTAQSDEVSLMKYLLHEALPLTVPYAPETLTTISYHPVKSHVLVFSNTSSSEDGFVGMIDSLSHKYKGRMLFIEINPEEYHLASYFGLRRAIMPQLVVVNMTDPDDLQRFYFADFLHQHITQEVARQLQVQLTQQQQQRGGEPALRSEPATASEVSQFTIHPIPTTVDAESGEDADIAHDSMVHVLNGVETPLPYTAFHIDAFLTGYLQGTLPRKLLSETAQEMDRLNEHTLGGYVENIAGCQFQARVMSREWQNSFVYFHAPWCAHCKSLEPVMSEIGKHYLEDSDFMLFRIDGIKNDVVHPRVRVNAYPSLFLFPAHNKGNPIEYDGERTIEAIVDFIDTFKYTARAASTSTGTSNSNNNEETAPAPGDSEADTEALVVADSDSVRTIENGKAEANLVTVEGEGA